MIKVAGYCRVSTDKDDQLNSFQTQKAYFREYIQQNPDWELYAIYADEGITGTSTKKRKEFNRMMNDAYEGKFQIIITKEVSRFSRNILDTIAYTRELRAMGIGVIFATDRIHTLEPESEMILSYIAAQSQEESRRTSARVVWGQTRQMEKGVVFGQSLLGYDVKDGKLSVNPEGAEIVRFSFQTAE
jgi:DNA invertase Pin-like site-specific DNA recombinase